MARSDMRGCSSRHFYRYQTVTAEADLDTISAQPVAFTIAVRATAEAGWAVIGRRELEPALLQPVVQFHQDDANYRKCTIFDSVGNVQQATPEECLELERAAVWEDHAVKQRLLDTFAGRPNATFERLQPKLS